VDMPSSPDGAGAAAAGAAGAAAAPPAPPAPPAPAPRHRHRHRFAARFAERVRTCAGYSSLLLLYVTLCSLLLLLLYVTDVTTHDSTTCTTRGPHRGPVSPGSSASRGDEQPSRSLPSTPATRMLSMKWLEEPTPPCGGPSRTFRSVLTRAGVCWASRAWVMRCCVCAYVRVHWDISGGTLWCLSAAIHAGANEAAAPRHRHRLHIAARVA
jgi:hypothetical protein